MQKNSIHSLSNLAVPLKSKGRFFKENKTFRSEQIPGSALHESCYSLLIDSHTRDC